MRTKDKSRGLRKEEGLVYSSHISINRLVQAVSVSSQDLLSYPDCLLQSIPGFFREMADCKSGAGKMQGELESACSDRRQGSFLRLIDLYQNGI